MRYKSKDRQYGTTEVGQILCVSRTTISRYADVGVIECSKDIYGRKRFTYESIMALRRKMYDIADDEPIKPTTRRYNLSWDSGKRYARPRVRNI